MPKEDKMAEGDRYRNDQRWNRDPDWGGGGSSDYNENSRRRFSEEDQYGRSRDYSPTSDFGRSGRSRGDFGRGDFDPDFQRNSNLDSGYRDSPNEYRRGYDQSTSDRPDFRQDQRGRFGGLGYGGSSPGGYGAGRSRGYGSDSQRQYAQNYGSRSTYEADWPKHGRNDFQRDSGHDDRGFIERAADTVSSWFGGDEQPSHRGRGPKGYARSDDRIREDVCDRLGDDWMVDASEVEVTVASGEVTLAGTVTSRDQRRRAEDLAESVSGVKHVHNNLRITSSSGAAGGNVGAETPRSDTYGGSDAASTPSRKGGGANS
jgi:osmotically-inducible protein OsmY